MELEMIGSFISSYGFPIVACGYMAIVMNKTVKANTEATNSLAALVQRLIDKAHFEGSEDL